MIEPVTPDAARALLVENELPIDDLDDPAIELLGAFANGALAGVVGLQRYGTIGLLRSLAVAREHRDRGIARALCERVFELARARSLVPIYLLTTSAADYFTRHGFVAIERDQAPAEIRTSAQFATLCPASARVMRRDERE
jgi:amino-acid N-acetyltransferase